VFVGIGFLFQIDTKRWFSSGLFKLFFKIAIILTGRQYLGTDFVMIVVCPFA